MDHRALTRRVRWRSKKKNQYRRRNPPSVRYEYRDLVLQATAAAGRVHIITRKCIPMHRRTVAMWGGVAAKTTASPSSACSAFTLYTNGTRASERNTDDGGEPKDCRPDTTSYACRCIEPGSHVPGRHGPRADFFSHSCRFFSDDGSR